MSVKQCQKEVTSKEFSRWAIYYQKEPFGEWRADLRSANIANILANAYSAKGHSSKIEDHMFFDKKSSKAQTPEQMKNMLMVLKKSQEAKMKMAGR